VEVWQDPIYNREARKKKKKERINDRMKIYMVCPVA